ncbi:MAG: ABC transporter ATP-binding protein [Flavobacteriia bacterium]|jgi:ABC-2 type transport system ATP-binding protein|nr:ATP-binding cassette domain-containing protein [Cryomorphaceae bacterium]
MLEVQHISKSFFRKTALEDVSMTVREGEIFGLLGPNGAGKTTLIRVINRIIEADRGVVRINGDLMTQKHLSMVGYLPEERGLYKSMTVEDHALFLGQLRGIAKRDVKMQLDHWLEKFAIGDWRRKRIEELSKGMAQKVQFICTVLHEPKILILDEPLSGFDPVNVELIKQEIVEMRAKGKMIILSTHNMKSVEEICDRVALIDHSKKILEGTVSDIRESRKTGEIAIKFSGSMIAFVNALWTNFELVDKEILGEDRFVARLKTRGETNFDDLLRAMMGQVRIEAVWEVLPSMQDIFIELVTPKSEGTHA